MDSLSDTGASSNFVSKEVLQINIWPALTPEKASVSVFVNKEQQRFTERCSLDVGNNVHPQEESSFNAVQISPILIQELRKEVENHEKMDLFG